MNINIPQILPLVAYNILGLGAVYGLKGLVQAVDLGHDLVTHCIQRCAQNRFHSLESRFPSTWKKGIKVCDKILTTTQNIGLASLTGIIGLLFIGIANDIGKK